MFKTSPIYFGANGEYAHLDRQTRDDGTTIDDRTLGRFDFTPQVRYPFKRWPFLTVNSSFSWRETYYTRSLDPNDTSGNTVLPGDVNRQYFTLLAQVVGPVFMRVWNTPNNGYAERFKHTIEPFLNIQRTSAIDNYYQIVKIESTDQVFGGTTSYSYGLNNRFYAKRKVGPDEPGAGNHGRRDLADLLHRRARVTGGSALLDEFHVDGPQQLLTCGHQLPRHAVTGGQRQSARRD